MMKMIDLKVNKLLLLVFFIVCFTESFSQAKDIPEVSLTTLDGGSILSTEIVNKEGATIISFWATWCKPCILELNELNDLKEDWADESNVEIIAISIDDARSSSKVSSFVSSRGWDFKTYLDVNSEFKRALNINNIPHTVLIDKSGKLVWQHAGYVPGDEEVLYEEVLKLEE